jgi:hypothetical protein
MALFGATTMAHAEPCREHASDTGYASADYVNLRAQSDSAGRILRVLAFGTQFKVVKKNSVCSTVGDKTGRWISVRVFDDDEIRDGWVFDSHITYQENPKPHSPELITAMTIYKEMLPNSFGQLWMGLAKTANGYELKQYSLKVKKTSQLGIDDAPMYRIVAVPDDKVLFLMRGIDRIKPGRVVAAQPVSRQVSDWQTDEFTVSLGSEKYRWSTGCKARYRAPKGPGDAAIKDYVCGLKIKGPANAVFSMKSSAGEPADDVPWITYRSIVELVWAGDLDGEGKLDFLLTEATNSSSIDTLFLSSLAKKRHLVHAAASNYLVWD